MTEKNIQQNNLADTAKVEAIKNSHHSKDHLAQEEAKPSYAKTILSKRKAALENAKKAYEEAIKKRESELGKLCLECGLEEYDLAFLKEQLLKLIAGFPKSTT